VFVDVAGTLLDDFDVVEFLHAFAAHAVRVSGGTAAGVLVTADDGTLQHVGASSQDGRLLELFQIQDGEGPCLDSLHSGESVVVPDLATATARWPSFAPRALELGVASVHSFPMRFRDRVIGGLNVFHDEERTASQSEHGVLQAMADLATIALVQAQAVSRAEMLNKQLQMALDSRVVVEQAKGAVARSLDITVEEAFERLRTHARSTRRRLTEVADEVLSSPGGPDLLRRD
jgi:GAF domain-containing protein